MNILLFNPNTTAPITDRMREVAQSYAAAETTITSLTAKRGLPYISTRAEALLAGGIALEMLSEVEGHYDAVVLAAFGDPGLLAIREMMSVPVVGMAEASMLTASMLGRTFSIVTFSTGLEAWYRDCVEANGMTSRCAGICCLDEDFTSINTVQHEKTDALMALTQTAVVNQRADVVILAGAPLAGLSATIRDRVPVPLVEGIGAAIKQAEALAALRVRKAAVGSYRLPAGKPSIGFSKPLEMLLQEPHLVAMNAGRS